MLAARETKMLSAERMERMIDAPTNDEAAKILEECGYGDLSGLSAKAAGAALEAHIAALFDEVEGMVPEAQLVQLFRLKYDYHNAKALIKAQAMGVECDAILSQRGTIPPQKLHAAFYEEDYRDIPSVLAQAMVSAAAILAHTANPQAADFELDRAYFAQMLDLANGLSDGGFARDYVQLQIDTRAIDLIPEALEFARMGILPAGMYRNRTFAEPMVDAGSVELAVQDMLYDPQTAGGLLIACDPADADALFAALKDAVPSAQRVGTVQPYAGGARIYLK